MHNKSFIAKWANRSHFFIDEKKFQKLGLKEDFISIYSY